MQTRVKLTPAGNGGRAWGRITWRGKEGEEHKLTSLRKRDWRRFNE